MIYTDLGLIIFTCYQLLLKLVFCLLIICLLFYHSPALILSPWPSVLQGNERQRTENLEVNSIPSTTWLTQAVTFS